MRDLIPSGRFPQIARLTRKALQIYAEQGLLRPVHTDPHSGYHYYNPQPAGRSPADHFAQGFQHVPGRHQRSPEVLARPTTFRSAAGTAGAPTMWSVRSVSVCA
ncbi:hypothetical protein [Deinococcus roseus]|uniref:HTH merR-type domain-containing protein n=1 Tax=Deinococcus roseus TaxID=392414 RepID=A0ABQ2DBJ2_9DEIO|nr:hypothetical protein [Deinococcus roseus]GGJ52569.1 hypothetical protein GCM10008938_43200 [Deinococcus roseus]